MFSELVGYAEKSFAEAHPVIEWETEAGVQRYTVYAAAAVKKTDAWYGFTDAADEAELLHRLGALSEKAIYFTGAAPEYGDRLLTLSTCYGATKDDRLIVIAVAKDERA